LLGYKKDFKDISWVSPMEGINFKALKDDKKQLRLVEYSNNMEPHWCNKGHMGYVLQGEMEIVFDNEKIIVSTGDGLLIPDGEKHRHMAKVLSDKAILIMVEDI